MSKVKESKSVKCFTEGEYLNLDVLWYCDDEEGYGVEILARNADSEFGDFAFGQDEENKDYAFSFKFYCFILDLLENDCEKAFEVIEQLKNYQPNHKEKAKILVSKWITENKICFN